MANICIFYSENDKKCKCRLSSTIRMVHFVLSIYLWFECIALCVTIHDTYSEISSSIECCFIWINNVVLLICNIIFAMLLYISPTMYVYTCFGYIINIVIRFWTSIFVITKVITPVNETDVCHTEKNYSQSKWMAICITCGCIMIMTILSILSSKCFNQSQKHDNKKRKLFDPLIDSEIDV
jgi:hypothetical protein